MTTFSTNQIKKIIKPLAALLFWMAVWQLAATGVGKELILPSPVSVFKALLALCVQKQFWLTAGTSLLRIACGFLLGVLSGVILAILTHTSKIANALLSPLVRVVRATPVASFIILVLLWVSRALVPAVMAALMVIPVVWAEVSTAISATDRELLEMAGAYKFGPLNTLRLIYIPSVMPQFISACLTAQGLSWKSGIAAEVLCQPKLAIGTMLYTSKIYLETPDLFAWTAIVILISFCIEKLCKLIFSFASARKKSLKSHGIRNPRHGGIQNSEITASGLCLNYDDKRVFDNFSISLPKSPSIILTGPSGCGKSTFLHVLAGLVSPESGEVTGLPNTIGIMFQENRLLPWLSAAENVAAVSDRETAERLLEELGMSGDLETMPDELSGGMKRRVALARAMAYSPDLLLLDEPFNGLDSQTATTCAQFIRQLGIQIVAVTHSQEEMAFLDGDILRFEGPPLTALK